MLKMHTVIHRNEKISMIFYVELKTGQNNNDCIIRKVVPGSLLCFKIQVSSLLP